MHRLKASIALSAFALTLSQVARAQDEQPTPLTPIPGPSSAGPTEGQSSPAPTPQSTSEGPTERPSSPATLPPVVVEKPVVRRTNVKPKPRPNLHAERRPVTRAASVERQPSSLQPVGPPPASDGSGPLTSGQTSGTNAYAVSDSTTATKTNTPLMQTPATVTVVPQQVLIDQAVTDLQGAMRNVPGVTVGGGASNDSGQPYSALYIRGFPATTFLRNGYRSLDDADNGVFSTQFVNVDQIQVLQGPAAILYGSLEPGGVVNVITKQPLSAPYYSIEQQIGSYGDYRTTFDLTRACNAGQEADLSSVRVMAGPGLADRLHL